MKRYIDKKTGVKMCCADTEENINWIVVAVKPEDDYTLLVDFIDGTRKRFNMKPLIERSKIFAKLKDPEIFKLAHTDGTTVVWDDTLDIAPKSLYEKGVPA